MALQVYMASTSLSQSWLSEVEASGTLASPLPSINIRE
jgi:hypothetical protein